jgi:plastocyanin
VIAAAFAAVVAATTPVGVSAREYHFALGRHTVPAGSVALNLHNFGEDAHNVQVSGPHGYRSAASPDVESGDNLRFVVRLRKPGLYRLVCTKPGHAAAGMTATLRVR